MNHFRIYRKMYLGAIWYMRRVCAVCCTAVPPIDLFIWFYFSHSLDGTVRLWFTLAHQWIHLCGRRRENTNTINHIFWILRFTTFSLSFISLFFSLCCLFSHLTTMYGPIEIHSMKNWSQTEIGNYFDVAWHIWHSGKQYFMNILGLFRIRFNICLSIWREINLSFRPYEGLPFKWFFFLFIWHVFCGDRTSCTFVNSHD